MNDVLGHDGTLADGVSVIYRDDKNYFEAADNICRTVEQMLAATDKERDKFRKNAAKLAEKAQWKHFIKHYYEAYGIALGKVARRK